MDDYTEINLDDTKAPPDDLEIIHEEAPAPEAEPASKPAARQPANEDDDDDDGADTGAGEGRKRPTRSQRLKSQRDAYASQLAEERRKREDAERRASRYEQDANDGASIGLDLLINNIDSSMKALRRDFDSAFDSGDRDKIFDVQQRMSELAAEKKQAEREKRAFPTKPAQDKSGSAPAQQTPQTSRQTASNRAVNPAAGEWFSRNDTWFNKDEVLTAVAKTVDQQMVRDGFDPTDPDYFEELDKRLKREMPTRFNDAPGKPRATSPTVQNRGAPPVGGSGAGKVRVMITQADRDMAGHLGLPIETYAREKARRERSLETNSQYTEII
jgi:hypothetical protein